MRTATLVMIVLGCLTPSASAADVLIVDSTSSTPGAYSSLTAAISDAADGDIIRIVSNLDEAAGFGINGKALTIVADPGVVTSIERSSVIHLAAGKKVVLRNLSFPDAGFGGKGGLHLFNNAGDVILERVACLSPLVVTVNDLPMLRIASCASVFLIDCEIEGIIGQAQDGAFPPGLGLRCESSTVYTFGGSIHGAPGKDASQTPFFGDLFESTPGGDGIHLMSGSLVLNGTDVRGGDGGDGHPVLAGGCLDPSDGGDGIVSAGTLRLMETTPIAGAAGTAAAGCSVGANPGVALNQVAGTVTQSSTPLRRVSLASPIVTGTSTSLQIEGQPGDLVIPLLFATTQPLWVSSLEGVVLGPLPAPSFVLGVMPPTGVIDIAPSVPANSLPAGVDGIDLFVQCIILDSAGNGWLSSPSASVVIQ